MATICRRYVTLLELLIVIAILALVGGLVSIGVNKALVDQRFRTEVSLIVDQLRLAQDLMLILGTDVRVVFGTEKGDRNSEGIKYWLELETNLSPGIEREILRKHSNLKTIKVVSFKDQLMSEQPAGQTTVRFQSKGAAMSQGVMRLATAEDERSRSGVLENYICLPGYPRPIAAVDSLEEVLEACNAAIEAANDTRLTQDTFSKLPDILKAGSETESKENEIEKNAAEKPSNLKNGAPQNKSRPARK